MVLRVVVDPEAAHRVVHGGVDAHRHLVGVLVGDLLVHLEQVAVLLRDGVLAEALDRVAEVEVDAEAGLADAAPVVAASLAAREATSRGTRLPKLGYLRSR